MQKIEKIKNTMKKYDIYSRSLEWENSQKEVEIDCVDWIICNMFCAYNDNELVSVGLVNNHYDPNDLNCALVTIRNNPNNQDELIINNLLKTMLEFSKNELNAKSIVFKTKKENLVVIDQIEKDNYDFIKFDDETITFKKKLINKEV